MYVLFVDLTGFSDYTERHGERAAAELASSFTLKAMQLGRRSGLRPIKTVGDAVIFVSASCEDAARGAEALLRFFDGHTDPSTVHIGLASGEVLERDGDVFGFPVNMAAHLSAIATAGQAVLDSSTARSIEGTCFRVRDIDVRAGKGLSRGAQLYELVLDRERVAS
jgi:adenylate cyclase